MNTRRNSITIGLLWLSLIFIGSLWYTKETKQLKKMNIKNKKLSQQLDGSLEVIQTLKSTENKYYLLKQKWDQAPKKILAVEEPSFSLHYLNWLVNKYDLLLDFDFALDNINNNEDDISTFRFTLTGEGSYHDIYHLIWLITKNPLLYQIESFFLRSSPNLLDFKMEIQGFSLTEKWGVDHKFSLDSMRPVASISLFHDAFKSLRTSQKPKRTANMFYREISKPLSKPKADGLIDVAQSTLQAVANGRAYLKDKNGKLIGLKVGDKVHLGILKNINQKKSEVEFILNKQGVNQKITLGLGYKK